MMPLKSSANSRMLCGSPDGSDFECISSKKFRGIEANCNFARSDSIVEREIGGKRDISGFVKQGSLIEQQQQTPWRDTLEGLSAFSVLSYANKTED